MTTTYLLLGKSRRKNTLAARMRMELMKKLLWVNRHVNIFLKNNLT